MLLKTFDYEISEPHFRSWNFAKLAETMRVKKRAKKKEGADLSAPTHRSCFSCVSFPALKRVARAELHSAVERQGSGEESEVTRYIRFNINRLHIEPGAVERIVNIPTELQLLPLGDVKHLVQAHVGIEVSRSAKGVAASNLASKVLAIGIDRGGVILEHVGLSVYHRHSGWRRWSDLGGVARQFPVRG